MLLLTLMTLQDKGRLFMILEMNFVVNIKVRSQKDKTIRQQMNQVTWFSKQSYVNQILIRRILQHTAKLNVMSWCQVLRGS